jgi:hypothetical protein
MRQTPKTKTSMTRKLKKTKKIELHSPPAPKRAGGEPFLN